MFQPISPSHQGLWRQVSAQVIAVGIHWALGSDLLQTVLILTLRVNVHDPHGHRRRRLVHEPRVRHIPGRVQQGRASPQRRGLLHAVANPVHRLVADNVRRYGNVGSPLHCTGMVAMIVVCGVRVDLARGQGGLGLDHGGDGPLGGRGQVRLVGRGIVGGGRGHRRVLIGRYLDDAVRQLLELRQAAARVLATLGVGVRVAVLGGLYLEGRDRTRRRGDGHRDVAQPLHRTTVTSLIRGLLLLLVVVGLGLDHIHGHPHDVRVAHRVGARGRHPNVHGVKVAVGGLRRGLAEKQ